MQAPEVSVVVTCHNYGHLLRNCLGSLAIQTYRNFEVVVVHTGTDGSIYTAAGIRPEVPTIRHYQLPYDTGISLARNFGVGMCDGRFIVNVDADDIVNSQFLAKLIPHAVQGWIVAPDIWRVEESSMNVQRTQEPFRFEDFKERNRIFAASMFHRTDFYAAGAYDLALDYLGCEDWDLWIRMVHRGVQVVQVREPLYYYRVHDQSHTARMKPHYEERLAYIKSKYADYTV